MNSQKKKNQRWKWTRAKNEKENKIRREEEENRWEHTNQPDGRLGDNNRILSYSLLAIQFTEKKYSFYCILVVNVKFIIIVMYACL